MHKKQQQNIYFYKYISKNAVLQLFQRENIAIQETLTPPPTFKRLFKRKQNDSHFKLRY